MQTIGLVAAAVARMAGEEGAPSGNGTLVIDLFNLEWWQALIGIIGLLGLSPAPWILGLATNKLQFTATADANYEKRVAELTEHHDALVAVKDERYADLEATAEKNALAVGIERERADAVTAALVESTGVAEMAVHVIGELRQAAQGVDTDGGKQAGHS